MASHSLYAVAIVIQIVIILLMAFHIQDMTSRCKTERVRDQERLTRIARLLVQSATQSHPLFAHDHVVEAKVLLDDLITRHGGIQHAEKNLRLMSGKVSMLKDHIQQQLLDIQTYLMETILEKCPQLQTTLNESAGLVHYRSESVSRQSKHNKL